ncbi:MAG: DUF2282 domain-containing protein [Burkholderiales bacterium]|nr:DUF2282 domain-containing protein [Burkholderiales bacterium]
MKKVSIVVAVAISGSMIISGCNNSKASDDNQLVECDGVSTTGQSLLMTKAMCEKLANKGMNIVNTADYVSCYGVAASGKNDCATNTVSCGGKIKVDRSPDAFVSLPKGVCANLMGSSITEPKK